MSCRLTSSITPLCNYDLGGIKEIYLLPISDLVNIIYKEDLLADVGLIEDIIIADDFISLGATDKTIYSQTQSKDIYTHQITTYISNPDGVTTSLLTKAIKNKYLVVYKTTNQKYFLFGSDFGTSLSYTMSSGAVGDGTAYTITLNAFSRIPLLETIGFTTHKKDAEPNTLPDYIKEPEQTRYIEINPLYSLSSTNRDVIAGGIYSINWNYDNEYIPTNMTSGGLNKGTYKTRVIGEYEWMLENLKLHYMNVNKANGYPGAYRLTDDIVNAAQYQGDVISYIQQNGGQFYAGDLSDTYLNGAQVYNLPNNYNPMYLPTNLFGGGFITHHKVQNGMVVEDKNYISWYLPPGYGNGNYTISRESATSTFEAYQVWGDLSIANPDIGNSSTLALTSKTGSMGTGVLFVVSSDGTPFDMLPRIKVEEGTTATTWIESIYTYKAEGWGVPTVEDFAQLFGIVGEDLSFNNLISQLFVSPSDDWYSSDWALSIQSNDTIGARLLPCGQKQNTDGGSLYGFGERMGFGTKRPTGDQSAGMPLIYFSTQKNSVYGLVLDNATRANSIKFWQHNYRLCRRLSDTELGYKLYKDEINDKIIVTSLSDSPPNDVTELEKGLLRGLAVRWLNEDKTEVLAPLSTLLEEVNKTKDDAGYNWVGWNN